MIKRICLFLLIFIAFISSLNAGKTFELDFNIHNYTLRLNEDDRVAFSFKNSENTIVLDEVFEDAVRLDVFLNLEKRRVPNYIYLNSKQNTMKLDIDRDDINDFSVFLVSLDYKNKRALLGFDKINEPKPYYKKSEEGGFSKNIFSKIVSYKILLGIGILVFLIIIIIIILFRIRKKRNDRYF